MADLTIPGASALGFGFDALGTCDVKSLATLLVKPGQQALTQFTYNGVTHDVPSDLSALRFNAGDGTVQSFREITDVREAMSARASISGGYRAFSGEFRASNHPGTAHFSSPIR